MEISVSFKNCCRALRLIVEKGEGVSCKELAVAYKIHLETARKILDYLEDNGWIMAQLRLKRQYKPVLRGRRRVILYTLSKGKDFNSFVEQELKPSKNYKKLNPLRDSSEEYQDA